MCLLGPLGFVLSTLLVKWPFVNSYLNGIRSPIAGHALSLLPKGATIQIPHVRHASHYHRANAGLTVSGLWGVYAWPELENDQDSLLLICLHKTRGKESSCCWIWFRVQWFSDEDIEDASRLSEHFLHSHTTVRRTMKMLSFRILQQFCHTWIWYSSRQNLLRKGRPQKRLFLPHHFVSWRGKCVQHQGLLFWKWKSPLATHPANEANP